MPGFGSGPFGIHPFGEWAWSRRILFEALPEIYRQQDQDSGGFLELFLDALRPSFDGFRHLLRDFIEVRDPLLVRTQYDAVRRLRLGPILGAKGSIEQRGVTGSVDGLQQFIAPTARFRVVDVGKPISISGSIFPINNRTVTIARVTGNTTVVTDPLISVDSGPLRWELRSKITPPTDRLTVEVRSGDISEIAPNWLVFDGFSDFTVLARRQFKVSTSDSQLLTEQQGVDGEIDNSGRFLSATAVLTQRDVGKHLTLVNSQVADNNGKYEITKIVEVSPGDLRAEIDASPILSLDFGLIWAVLPFGELDLSGTTPPHGTVEQEGVDLQVTSSGVSDVVFSSGSAAFSIDDVGKKILIRGSKTSPSNDGLYEVTSTPTTTTLTVAQRSPALIVETSNLLTWELRTSTLIGDFVQVDARATSMIVDLAPDFGISVDTQEAEDRQRGWVRNVSRWTDLKGVPDSYRIIGKISGFDITPSQLFRITPALFTLSPPSNAFEVGEAGIGRNGLDGTLAIVSLRARFSSPSAAFEPTDVGRQIRILLASTIGNNQLYTIDSIVSSTEVEFIVGDVVTLPDLNNGNLQWAIVRLYSNLPPLRPRFDEVRSDLLELIVETTSSDTLTFRADMYCWEETFDSTVKIDVISVSTITPGNHEVSLVGTLSFPTTPEVITGIGHWEFLSLAAVASGTGDLLTGTAPEMTLLDSSSTFGEDLVGQWIDISGATTSTNNGLFQILAVVSSTSIVFFNGSGSGEAFSGSFQLYRAAELFVDSTPVLTAALASGSTSGSGDLLTKVGVGTLVRLDNAAGLFIAGMVGRHVLISGATSPVNNGIFLIKGFISSTQILFDNISGITESFSGAWSIGLGVYTLQVSSAVAPTSSGPGQLRYVCDSQLSCDYCGSNKVMVLTEASQDLLAEGDVQVERLLERVTLRLEEEVKPAHVELIVQYRATMESSLIVSAEVEPTLT
jgi:hypothetical protein